MAEPGHLRCVARAIIAFGRNYGIRVKAATRPDHPCPWWKEHLCEAHDKPVWVHPTDEQLAEWNAEQPPDLN